MLLGLKVAWRKKIHLICNLVRPLIYLAAMLKSQCALVQHTNTQLLEHKLQFSTHSSNGHMSAFCEQHFARARPSLLHEREQQLV